MRTAPGRERPAGQWATVTLVLGLFSLILFVVSREATFSMWILSNDYAAAPTAGDKAAIPAAGVTLLALYNGGTFATSYLLGAISTIVFSATMFRHRVFGALPGLVGVATGAAMLVPPNTGQAGLVLSMVSLLPTAAWLALLSKHLFRLGATGPPSGGEPSTGIDSDIDIDQKGTR
ncbi:MAG: hypothetical protein V9G19_04040 [Tetrasphaera sp.]